MYEAIDSAFAGHAALVEKVRTQLAEPIAAAVNRLIVAFEKGRTLFLCGNGGSAADAQHIAAEFTGRFLRERRPLPAVALTTDTSALTAISNDFGFETVFERQLRALAQPGDVLIGISTSGNSGNVLKALEAARTIGCATVALTGHDGGKMRGLADLSIIVPSTDIPRIQEVQIIISHIICDLVDRHFAG